MTPEMEQSRQKIETVAKSVDAIEELLNEYNEKPLGELPTIYSQELHKQARHNRFESGMQSEHLMKHLMSLDNCLSYGSVKIKSLRKQLVVRIHDIMKQADECSASWLERTKIFEDLKPEPMIPSKTCVSTADALIPDVPAVGDGDSSDFQSHNITNETVRRMGLESVREESDDRLSDGDTDELEDRTGTHIDIAGESDSDSPSDMPPSPPGKRNSAGAAATSTNHETNHHVLKHRGAQQPRQMYTLPQWHPQTDISQDNTHIIVAAEVPGMTLDDFDLRIVDHRLLIQGQKQGSIQEQFAYRRGEPPTFGTLALNIRLPQNIHLQGDAVYEDGILQVRFPKKRRPAHPSWHRRHPRTRRNFWDPFGRTDDIFSLF